MKKLLFFLLFTTITSINWGQAKSMNSSKKNLTSFALPDNNPVKTSGVKSSKVPLNGQWGGVFNSNGDIVSSGDNSTEYVLEIQINGSSVSGYSYSYFNNRLYYVICSLAGKYDKETKTLNITETQRIKGNTPPDWNDCLQTHSLTYKKQDGEEVLTGGWRTAPGQLTDCGFGNTTLIKRTLSKNLASYNKSKNNIPFVKSTTTIKSPYIVSHQKREKATKIIDNEKSEKKLADIPSEASTPLPITFTVVPNKSIPVIKTTPDISSNNSELSVIPDIGYEKRTTEVLKNNRHTE
ncbi:MAG: hypothetical protein WDM71_05085 [Ferruginibacter sp.]